MAKKSPPIKYTSRDFSSIKSDLINYAKVYYSDTYKDFNEASFGAMMIDLVSYVGDQLSFYVDYQMNESFLDSAIETRNILKLAKQLGYKFPGAPSATGRCAFYIEIPAKSDGLENTDNIPKLLKGTTLAGKGGSIYTLLEDVDFSSPATDVVIAESSAGKATSYAYKAYGDVASGEIVTEIVEIGAYEKYMKIELGTENLSEVVSVVDSQGHEYFEVNYLSQNTVFKEVRNTISSTVEHAPYILRELAVPRRFTVEHTIDDKTFLQFGFGSESNLKLDKFPEPSSVTLKRHAKTYYSDDSFDPEILMTTDKLGIVPPTGDMVVAVRRNTTETVNAAANSVNTISNPKFLFRVATITGETRASIIDSLEATNEEPIIGETKALTPEELRIRALDAFASQNRAVTKQDYLSLIYRMPANFGAVKRANIVQDEDSQFRRNMNLYVISEDSDNKLIETPSTVKDNLKTWLNKHRMINDTIDILDGRIANISIEFEVLGALDKSQPEVLSKCINALTTEFATHFHFGRAFYISEIYRVLNDLAEVVDAKTVTIKTKLGTNYAGTDFDAEENVSSDGRFIAVPADVVLEIKHPNVDIIGVVS